MVILEQKISERTNSNEINDTTNLGSQTTVINHEANSNDVVEENKSLPQKSYRTEIVWPNAIGFLVLHLAAVYGFYLCLFKAKLLTGFWGFTLIYIAMLSTTMGSHRLYTHRTFKANKWIRLMLVIGHTLAGQNCLWVWIRDHRQHHKYSDTHGDPHNASRGFFFSHIGWLMVRKHPEIFVKGKTIDMSDIEADPMVMFQKKYYKTVFVIISMVIPTAIPCLVWDETLSNSFFVSIVTRLVFTYNFTWLVNSAAHAYGNKPFNKDILPSENWYTSVLTIGEGWHNYHHAFPWDYRAAEFGQYFNVTTSVIDYCARKGWVYDLKSASSELVKNQATNKGDGSHKIYTRKNK